MNEEERNIEERNDKNHLEENTPCAPLLPEPEADSAAGLKGAAPRTLAAGESRRISGTTLDDDGFTDTKQFPEDPFSYRASKREQVQLSSGTFQYEVTDFVLPGRDGFDLKVMRRYDSRDANRVEMRPYLLLGWSMKTGVRDNNHYNWIYGLGYGWSFVLPSIEAVPYMYQEPGDTSGNSHIDFQFVLHLEDGRSLKIKDKWAGFHGYPLEDVRIEPVSNGSITHPVQTDQRRNYKFKVQYKDGRIDYFNKSFFEEPRSDERRYVQDKDIYTLVAREDRFGNRIFYQMEAFGGMTIHDTWGRTITLAKQGNGPNLVWTLPKGADQIAPQITYEIETMGVTINESLRSIPEKLTAVINPLGLKTTYEYLGSDKWVGVMSYTSKDSNGTEDKKNRPYLLLSKITHPNGSETHYNYGYGPGGNPKSLGETDTAVRPGTGIGGQPVGGSGSAGSGGTTIIKPGTGITAGSGLQIRLIGGGYLSHFPLISRKEVWGTNTYYEETYHYALSEYSRYIETATVKRRGLTEKHTFNKEGACIAKELWEGTQQISRHTYTYGGPKSNHKGKIDTAVEWIKNRNDTFRELKKVTNWEYTTDQKANVAKVTETYSDDLCHEQVTEMSYSHFSQVIERRNKKNDAAVIRETYELDESKGYRVVRCHRVYENEELQAKTVYEYSDGNNPYCVTKERRYIQAGKGPLGENSPFVETSYSYNSSQYTHAPVKKTQTGLTDADGQRADDMEESYVYDAWGRLLTQTDPRGGKTYISYDPLGRITQKTLPQVGNQTRIEKTQYLDAQNIIKKTDVNGYVSVTAYTPFGQVKETALARPDGTVETVLQRFSYSPDGDLLEVLTYDGNGRVKKTEQLSYDSLGRCTSRKIPEVGYEEQNTYEEVYLDPNDHKKYLREQTTIKGDQNAPDQVMVRCLDQKEQLRRSYLADKLVAVEDYDWMGNRISSQDALGRKTTWTYDYAGRELTCVQQLNSQNITVKNWYDAWGNLRFQTDEAGQELEYRYDQAGRCIQTIAPPDHPSLL